MPPSSRSSPFPRPWRCSRLGPTRQPDRSRHPDLGSEAIRYARNQWKVLRRYTEDGRFEPDNGRSERALRLVANNRKNWLFAGAEDGGRWAATFWSLIGTCRLHDLDPEAYLRDLFQALPTHPINRVG